MTGIELVKAELASRGFNASKINMNMPLIEAMITILSDADTKSKIDLAEERLNDAKREHRIAFQEREDARENLRKAFNERREAERIAKSIADEKEKVITLKQEIDEMLKCETPEARDKMRLLAAFKAHLPEINSKNERSVIYSMGAILSGKELKWEGDNIEHKSEGLPEMPTADSRRNTRRVPKARL